MKLVMETFLQLLMKKKYPELKESIRMMNSKWSYTEKINLTEEVKKTALMRLLISLKSPIENNVILLFKV